MRTACGLIILFCNLVVAGRAAEPIAVPSKPELFLMLPEPRAMASSLSKSHAGAQRTVFTPARQTEDGRGVRVYTPAEFAKLGISWETFLERAEAAAEQRLATMQPELKKDAAGHVVYAVYHAEAPVIASLLVAPSLAVVFKNIFPGGVWLAAPNRNSLYVFPAKPEVVESFADELQDHFDDHPFAASEELFSLQAGEGALHAVASFKQR